MSLNLSTIDRINHKVEKYHAKWVAVTKMRSIQQLRDLYEHGKKVFGENKAQELMDKYDQLPKDIEWHFIGHLQTNKVRSIIDKVGFIHAVDSEKLLETIQKEAFRIQKVVKVLIQIHVAREETKYGFTPKEALDFLKRLRVDYYPNVHIVGLMAMASYTEDRRQIQDEFSEVRALLKQLNVETNLQLSELSMGMSGDYEIALECGSTMLRIGSILYNE